MVFTASLLGAQHKKGIVWRTSRQPCLLYPWARHLTRRLHLYVADRWPTSTSLDYNCEVANPACRKKRLLGTHQWQFALLVVGLSVTQDWFEMGCHLSPSQISIRLTAYRTFISRKRRSNHKQTNKLPFRNLFKSNGGITIGPERFEFTLVKTAKKASITYRKSNFKKLAVLCNRYNVDEVFSDLRADHCLRLKYCKRRGVGKVD